jgi:hypothetical protein
MAHAMLTRSDFGRASKIELALAGVGLPARVVGLKGGAVGLVLARQPRRGVLGLVAACLAAVLGAPVKLARRGRRVVAVVGV